MENRSLTRRLLGNASVYGIGIIVTRFGYLLLLPLVWQRLGPEDLGRVSVAQMVATLLGPIMTLNLHDSVQRCYFEWDETCRGQNLWTIWSITLAFGITFVLAIDLLCPVVWPLLIKQVAYAPIGRLVLWTTLCNTLTLLPWTLYRLQEQTRRYSLMTIGSFCTMTALVVVFLYVFAWGINGYLLGLLINAFLWCLIHSSYMWKEVTVQFRRECIPPALAYSLPTVPAAILDTCGTVFDRYFLDKHAPLDAIGRYSVAFQWSSILMTINTAMKASWLPLVFQMISERTDGREQLARLGTVYVGVFSIFALGLATLSEDVIAFIAPSNLQSSARLIPLFILGLFMQGMATGLGRGLDVSKRNGLTLVTSAVGVVASFLSMALLIPPFGIAGAVLGFVITSGVRSFLQIGLAMYVFPRPMHWTKLITITLVGVLGYFTCRVLSTDNHLVSFMIKLPLVGVCAIIVITTTVGLQSPLRFIKAVVVGKPA